MARFSKEDWLECGLQVLGEKGPNAIRIDQLCATAGRTRGSFYHHFKNRECFVQSLMEYWQQSRTKAVIQKTNAGATNSTQRLKDLALNVMGVEGAFETALRQWAASDENVASVLARTDQDRIAYIAELLGDKYGSDQPWVQDLALIQYALYLGMQNLGSLGGEDRRWQVSELLAKMSDVTFGD